MTLIEVLIAMAITATLMLALAAAFHASAGAVQFNDAYFRATQAARVALNEITGEIRRADAVKVDSTGTRMRVTPPTGQTKDGEISREYTFDAAEKKLTVQVFHADKRSADAYELATGVSNCSFRPDLRTNSTGQPFTALVSISITCSESDIQTTLSASAAPRRAQPAYNASP
jgi:Tfp pilus assembly protein PilW